MPYNPISGLFQPRATYGTRQTIPKFAYDYGLVTGQDPTLGRRPGGAIGSAPGGTITIPGFTPDYRALIEQDPIFSQLRADLSSQGISDAAQRAAATQRGLIQFGQIPDFQQAGAGLGLDTGFLGSDITEETRGLAQANTEAGLSIAARQARQNQQNIAAIRDFLAARGLLRSGATGVALGEEQQRHTQAGYDTRQQVLDYLAGVQAAFVQSERQRQQQLAQGAREAGTFQAGLPQNQPTGPQVIQQLPVGEPYHPPTELPEDLYQPPAISNYGVSTPFHVANVPTPPVRRRRPGQLAFHGRR